ncbi:MAG: hypothetical protein DYH08_08350 [Actinobacteria bacterium ATB1]|nr:hypothetical protein [Actinobacteria bacterium ATB1]
MSMEKLLGKVVHTSGFGQFIGDFLEWAGPNTAWARLVLLDTEIEIEATTERNADNPKVTARGLQGGGGAFAAWAESEGWLVLSEGPDTVVLEAGEKDMPGTAQQVAGFLAPKGNWTIEEITIRRKSS